MTFTFALLSLLVAAVPGNLVDMCNAAISAGSPRTKALRIASQTSLVVCPLLVVVTLFEVWTRMSNTSDRGWILFLTSLWSVICGYLLYGALRDYRMLGKKRGS